MESITTTSFTSVQLRPRPSTTSSAPRLSLCTMNLGRLDISGKGWNLSLICSNPFKKAPRSVFGRVHAAGSGLETSIADASDSSITLRKAKVSVESQTENQIELRVDVIGEETDRVFGQVLTNLARTAPPIPEFRRQKGGKTTKVPRDFLLQILGEERVTKFVIQEIVTSTVANYVKTEKLTVKDNKVIVDQVQAEAASS
ncbi:hypothetical protein MLD38_039688 [Melastoma candidum]|uniref:Uncharacterized protein n=1 Tax=Melastoma candidum TaxID=119954 RepID=A0ACB9L3A7_9MYRT|nr:hypothetical protein MLD38_039688 [Melastoma candidum]